MDTKDEDATSTATMVTIRENPKEGGVYLNGARTIEVDGVEGCLAVLNEGICRRSVAESTMNVRSSRSHAVLTLNIECKVGAAKATLAKLHLVDLAGSERVTLNETRGQRFKEGVLFTYKDEGKWIWLDNGDTGDGGKYEGQIENGKPNGHGSLIYRNGTRYVGEFKEGHWDGSGTLSFYNSVSGLRKETVELLRVEI